MERIVFILGQGQYGVFSHWIKEMQEELALENIDSYLLDLTETEGSKDRLNEAFLNPASCYVAINAQGCEFEAKPQYLYKNLKRPFLGICVDHPFWHHYRIMEADSNLFYAFIDPVHLEYAEKVYPESKPSLLLHAGSRAKVDHQPERDRPYDLVFLGTYRDPEKRRKNWPPLFANIIEECLELHRQDGILDYAALMKKVLSSRNMPFSPTILRQMYHLLFELDLYLRDTTRKKILDFLADAKIPVHLFGIGFEEYSNSVHHVHEQVSYEEALNIMAQSRCVLDINPNFPLGLHERILSAMLNGAALITDHRKFIDDALVAGENFVSYSDRKLEELPGKIEYLLQNNDERIAMAKKGQEIVASRHMWKHRVQSLIKLVPLLNAMVQ